MNTLSQLIYNTIIKEFPEYNNTECPDQDCLEFYIPTQANEAIGGLIIQTTVEDNVWIRIALASSGYLVDDITELNKIIRGTFEDKILWVIGTKENKWYYSTLLENLSQLDIENDVEYKIYSWSGQLDKIIEASFNKD